MCGLETAAWIELEEQDKKRLIANTLDRIMRQLFPHKYAGLCHVYAIVGASLLSVCFGSEFRPVAGIAVIPTGSGCLEMLDDAAFHKKQGGAYHCWIQSMGKKNMELVDLSFVNNAEYANACGVMWTKPKQEYLWGINRRINLAAKYHVPPQTIPDDNIWFRETENGRHWLSVQVAKHEQEYARITALVLRHIKLDLLGNQ